MLVACKPLYLNIVLVRGLTQQQVENKLKALVLDNEIGMTLPHLEHLGSQP